LSAQLDTVRIVEAPEGVELHLRVAGPFSRALAYIVDFLMRWLIIVVVSIIGAFFGGVGIGATLIMAFALEWFWPIIWEARFGGATPGKRALGLQVLRTDGRPIGWSESILRNFLRAVDFLPFGYATGLVACLAGKDFQRLGDRVAGTVVVYVDERAKIPRLAEAPPLCPPFNLTREEQAALVDFAVRVPTWNEARAREIAERLDVLTGERGEVALRRVVGMAQWIEGAR
jgi:uncharacterized RDD family membrane protein YckC